MDATSLNNQLNMTPSAKDRTTARYANISPRLPNANNNNPMFGYQNQFTQNSNYIFQNQSNFQQAQQVQMNSQTAASQPSATQQTQSNPSATPTSTQNTQFINGQFINPPFNVSTDASNFLSL